MNVLDSPSAMAALTISIPVDVTILTVATERAVIVISRFEVVMLIGAESEMVAVIPDGMSGSEGCSGVKGSMEKLKESVPSSFSLIPVIDLRAGVPFQNVGEGLVWQENSFLFADPGYAASLIFAKVPLAGTICMWG